MIFFCRNEKKKNIYISHARVNGRTDEQADWQSGRRRRNVCIKYKYSYETGNTFFDSIKFSCLIASQRLMQINIMCVALAECSVCIALRWVSLFLRRYYRAELGIDVDKKKCEMSMCVLSDDAFSRKNNPNCVTCNERKKNEYLFIFTHDKSKFAYRIASEKKNVVWLHEMLHALVWSMSEIGILSSCIKSSFKWNLAFIQMSNVWCCSAFSHNIHILKWSNIQFFFFFFES